MARRNEEQVRRQRVIAQLRGLAAASASLDALALVSAHFEAHFKAAAALRDVPCSEQPVDSPSEASSEQGHRGLSRQRAVPLSERGRAVVNVGGLLFGLRLSNTVCRITLSVISQWVSPAEAVAAEDPGAAAAAALTRVDAGVLSALNSVQHHGGREGESLRALVQGAPARVTAAEAALAERECELVSAHAHACLTRGLARGAPTRPQVPLLLLCDLLTTHAQECDPGGRGLLSLAAAVYSAAGEAPPQASAPPARERALLSHAPVAIRTGGSVVVDARTATVALSSGQGTGSSGTSLPVPRCAATLELVERPATWNCRLCQRRCAVCRDHMQGSYVSSLAAQPARGTAFIPHCAIVTFPSRYLQPPQQDASVMQSAGLPACLFCGIRLGWGAIPVSMLATPSFVRGAG